MKFSPKWPSIACSQALLGLLLVLLVVPSQAETIARSELDGLLAECDRQRQAKLKPHREAKIAECVEKGKQQDYCQRYYAEYGERMHRTGPGSTVGAFWNLPVCEKAIAAQRYFGKNPGKRRFDYTP